MMPPVRLGVAAALVNGRLLAGDVEIADGRIAALGLSSPGRSGVAAPGFLDLQVNGFAGVDFLSADRDGYRRANEALPATGVTAYLPTFVTASEDRLVAALRTIPVGDTDGARALGAHLEGPFLSPHRLGAHPVRHRVDPDPTLLERLLGAGPVKLVTLAPELPGAAELIALLVERGITVSLGHSDATAADANRAFDRGACTVTHLFNAMRPFHHRDPGLAGAALGRDDVVVQIVLDGVHVAPEAAALAWRAARGRIALVTDSSAAATLGEGRYELGPIPVEVRSGVARGPGGVLAGTTLTMLAAVRALHELGAPLAEALAAASEVPARVLGLREIGHLRVDGAADVVVLTEQLELTRVLVGGRDILG